MFDCHFKLIRGNKQKKSARTYTEPADDYIERKIPCISAGTQVTWEIKQNRFGEK